MNNTPTPRQFIGEGAPTPEPIPVKDRPFVHPLEQGPMPTPTQPAPIMPREPKDPYMGQGGPSPEQLEKLRIDQEAWSTNPRRFSSEPYWLNPFWYKPQGWRPTRPDTPIIGEGAPPSIGRPLPLPIERPPMQYIGEGAPPTGKSLPELLRNINMPFSGLMGDRKH